LLKLKITLKLAVAPSSAQLEVVLVDSRLGVTKE
jgi:hypothetical protein